VALRIWGGEHMLEMWTYRAAVVLEPAVDLTGFKVEAKDGSIGKVDESTADAGKSYIVVDTGPWILGRKVLLPAQTIERIDLDKKVVHVDRTKDEIKNAPEFDSARGIDEAHRTDVGNYYGQYYR
jgi:PRC-barrel domain protein